MNQPRLEAFIFDCDGTLVNSEEPGIEVIQALAKEAGVRITRQEAFDRFTGLKMGDIVDWVAAQLPHPVPKDFHHSFTHQVRKAQSIRFHEGLETIAGAKELLEFIRLPMGVATNGPREKVELTLQLTGLRSYFADHVYSAYDMGHFKPSPELFLHVAKALGVEPMHCAVVEDSLTGVTAGLLAQMQVFCLAPPKSLPAHMHPKLIFIEDLHDLKKHLIDSVA
jgi:HAD superfamily hydrolase (TIGR01509 family)